MPLNLLPKYSVLTSPAERLLPSRITTGVIHDLLGGWCHWHVRHHYAQGIGRPDLYDGPPITASLAIGQPGSPWNFLEPLACLLEGDDSTVFRGWGLTGVALTTETRDRILPIITTEHQRLLEATQRARSAGVLLPGYVLAHAAMVRDRTPEIHHPAVHAWIRSTWVRRSDLPWDDLGIHERLAGDLLLGKDDGTYERAVKRELLVLRLGGPEVESWRWYGANVPMKIRLGHWAGGIPTPEADLLGLLCRSDSTFRDRLAAFAAEIADPQVQLKFLAIVAGT